MALGYHPRPGEILLCDYGSGFIVPEMVKRRPVVVVSPRLRRRANLVAVVPLSTTEPNPLEQHQCQIVLAQPLPQPFDEAMMWAKADMLATVSMARLDRFRLKVGGQRQYRSGQVTPAQLTEIRRAILHGLGMGSLTLHL